MRRFTLGLVGLGNIGTCLARGLIEHALPYDLRSVNDIDEKRIDAFLSAFPDFGARAADLDTLAAGCEVIVEAASASVVPVLAESALAAAERSGAAKHLFIMSAGGLLDLSPDFRSRLGGSSLKLIVPSGAIGGLDALSAMSLAGVDEVVLTTRKPPSALGLANTEPELVYAGRADGVYEKFPANINVAITLALATVGLDRLELRLVSDPQVKANIHEIEAAGAAGRVRFTLENVPSPANPKTSCLAALSIVSALRRHSQNLLLGC